VKEQELNRKLAKWVGFKLLGTQFYGHSFGGDAGVDTRLQLIQQADGDVVLALYNPTKGSNDCIEFCSSSGGGRYPWIAEKLREMIANFQDEWAMK